MNYELILSGDKKLIVDDLTAKKILAAVEKKAEIIDVQGARFRFSMFKGLFPIKEEVSLNKEKWINENREWNEICMKMSKYSIDKKVEVEIENRIIPGLKLAKIDVPNSLFEPMRVNVREFFENNPLYPRCPMRIWWPFIRAYVAPLNKKTKTRPNPNIYLSQWFKIVIRNDGAIEEWVQYQLRWNNIKIK